MERVTQRTYSVPDWGVGELWVRRAVVVHHVLPGSDPTLDLRHEPLGPAPTAPTRNDFVEELCERFTDHLHGTKVTYEAIEIDVGEQTPFEEELTRVARAIPWGEVVTYGELAALAGRPGAARAAGSFCARGALSLLIPYHRVVASNGIGGYGLDGLETKRRLLALEGVRL